jgi:hypothetical protein
MTTKNQDYIELPVQDNIGTPEQGFVSLGFAGGKFRGKDAMGRPLFFYPPRYSETLQIGFDTDVWTGSAPDLWCQFGPLPTPFDESGMMVVQVRDSSGLMVLGGVYVGEDGIINLFSAAPYAGCLLVTGVITTG